MTEVVKEKLFRAKCRSWRLLFKCPGAKIIVILIHVSVKNRFVCYLENTSNPQPSLESNTAWCIVLKRQPRIGNTKRGRGTGVSVIAERELTLPSSALSASEKEHTAHLPSGWVEKSSERQTLRTKCAREGEGGCPIHPASHIKVSCLRASERGANKS